MDVLSNIVGAYPKPPKIYQVVQELNVEGIEDGARLLDHYLVDMRGSYLLVDAKGCAYIGDIDIVSIQRRLASGHVGPAGQSTVFQHGGLSGTAGFFGKHHEAFDFFGSKTLVGWSPKGDWD